MTDAEDRLVHAADTLRMLFPGGTVSGSTVSGSTVSGSTDVSAGRPDPRRRFAVAPSAGHPRLLVPLAPRAATSAALRAYGGRLDPMATWGYRLASGTTRLCGAVPFRHRLVVEGAGIGAIDDLVADVLGRQVSVAIHLTPARANRKPILQALVAGGRFPAGFVKVADMSLTRSLVQAEAATLEQLADRPRGCLVLPTVLGHATNAGREILTLSPLPTWSPGRLATPTETRQAADDVAGLGPRRTAALEDSGFWSRLSADLEAMPAGTAAARLREVAATIGRDCGRRTLELGSSHGDFSPWNMWRTSHGVLLWDWERYAEDVPVGSDLVHYALQEALVSGGGPERAAHRVLATTGEVLTDVTDDAQTAALVGVAHLLSLAVRYVKDGQADAGNDLGQVERWLLPALETALTAQLRVRS